MSNLIFKEDKEAILSQYRMRFITVTLSYISILVFAACALLVPSLLISKDSVAALEQKKASYEGKETSELETSLNATITEINTKLDLFSDATPTVPLTKSMLDRVQSAKDATIRITLFNYTLGANPKTADIQISGIADNRASLLAFGKRLQGTEGITSVVVPITSFIKDQNVPFTISLSVALK